jgi:gluconate kinase
MPEQKLLLILFGLPGAGKTYAGRLLRDDFGFHFHESDEDIPDDYRRLVQAGQVVSEERRDAFHRALLDRVEALWHVHPRLAVAVPLLRHKHREWFRHRLPAARFLLVHCAPERWEARLAARTHTIGADYARKILPLYEPPALEHFVLDDTEEGEVALRAQLRAIVEAIDAQ